MIYIGLIVVVVVQPTPQPQEVAEVKPEVAGMVVARCPACGWHSVYDSPGRARQGLGGHKRWCKQFERHYRSPFEKPLNLIEP